MIISVQMSWWVSGVGAILASIMIFYMISLSLIMRDTCKVAKENGPNYEQLLFDKAREVFSDCSATGTPYSNIVSPYLSIPYTF